MASRPCLALWFLANLAACSGSDDKGQDDTVPGDDTELIGETDADEDGYTSDEDCDDGDPDINPGAAEICDGIDNNCDEQTDDSSAAGQLAWYTDADGDGYGDPETSTLACDQPEGAVADGTDCDDDNASAHPGGAEVCDGADNDCNGETDGADATDIGTWYADADSDGYGDPSTAQSACDAPPGTVESGTDCDDADADIHPDAVEDDCSDPTDYNCDGSSGYSDADGDGFPACTDCDDGEAEINTDAAEVCDGVDNDCDLESDEASALDASTWYADTDADGFGDPESTAVACDQPDGYVDDARDCDDTDPLHSPDAEETCDGADDDCDGDIDEGDAFDRVTWYADVDGDGYGDPATSEEACAQPEDFVEDNTDCDDSLDTVNPAADEICDELDDDCDGEIDEDAVDQPTWYGDADGDGYGSSADTALSCTAPEGHVDNPDDCDDALDTVNPAADETCDELDDDCDGEIDEDDAVDAPVWYLDGDDDGFGDASSGYAACELPDGYVAATADGDDHDCDDTRAAVNPDADETCDGLDDDCDGTVDEDDAVDAQTWYADADEDGFGDADETTLACDTPSGYLADPTDCDDTRASVNPGADEICDELDDDCDGEIDESSATDAATWYADTDADGFGDPDSAEISCEAPSGHLPDNTDCDDTRDSVNPDADERCNELDDDCDGTTDEDDAIDAPVWYADGDDDGYGDPASAQVSCEAPSGSLADSSDCDDTRDTVNPAGIERCNTLDDNCDGVVDEDSAVDALTWYADADADGFGNAEDTTVACTVPSGYLGDSTDCDDTLASVNPDADERCDSLDDDCDGVVDEDDAIDAPTWYADADADGFGDADLTKVQCDTPSGYVALGTDCDDADLAVNPDAAEICEDGTDNDCDGGSGDCALAGSLDLLATDAVLLGEKSSDKAGASVAMLGDSDGDGLGDLLIGAPGSDKGATTGGAAYLVLGAPAGSASLSTAVAAFTGEAASDGAGDWVGAAGDLDEDGYADLLIGAMAQDAAGSASGSTYFLYGPQSGTVKLADAEAKLTGEAAGDKSGSMALGSADLSGDGDDDLVIGARASKGGGYAGGGAVYVVEGPPASASLSTASALVYGTSLYAYAGNPATPGDLDGDGLADLVIGGEGVKIGSASGGGVFFFSGPVAGSLSTSDADATYSAEKTGDYAGFSLDGAEDADGDGYTDLVVGAYGNDNVVASTGAAYLLLGPPSGNTALSDGEAKISGTVKNDYLGYAVAGAGDTDGDGLGDLLVGAYANDDAGTDAGLALLFLAPLSGAYTPPDADASVLGHTAGDAAGYAVAGRGDLDGDGKGDVAVGAYFSGAAATKAGAVAILFGTGL